MEMATLNEQMAVIRRHQTEPPVPVISIARDLGINVYRAPNLSGDISGLIRRDTNSPGGYSIYVNGNHPETRRRFTIAHEIAHLLLHRSLIGDGISDDALYRSGFSNAIERQANQLAADILMPRHLLNQQIANGVTEIERLARIFNVSPATMSIQMGVPYDA